MNDETFDILAFDIGGTQGRCGVARCGAGLPDGAQPTLGRLKAELRTFEFSTIHNFRRANGEDGPAWLRRLIESAKELCPSAPRFAAVSFGGPVEPDGSIRSMHVPGWENVDLTGAISAAFGLERAAISVENDANAGALGEHRLGAGRGCSDMLYFTVSTGIGGGVILGGKLRRGAHGLAGEFGHIVLDGSDGAPQYAAGKPGALEALASGPAMEREGRAALVRTGRAVPENFSAKSVFDAAEAGEEWAVETRARCVAQLGRGIAAMVCAYDVERVVVGGGVALAGDALFVPLRRAVDGYLPTFLSGKVKVLPALLGDSAPIMGAVAACLDKA